MAGCVARGTPPIDPCKNHVIDEALSPGRDLRAVVFERRCGKPVGYSTQVAVVAADARLGDQPGNVFIAANGGRFSRGRSFVTVSWSGPTKLTVAFTPDAPVFRIERSVGLATDVAAAAQHRDHGGLTSPSTRPTVALHALQSFEVAKWVLHRTTEAGSCPNG